MKKRLRSVFTKAIITAMGIIAFQLFWLRGAYLLEKNNFFRIATTDLQNSIDGYQIEQASLAPGKTAQTDFFIVVDSTKMSAPGTQVLSMSKDNIDLTQDNSNMVKTMMARLLSQVKGSSPDLNKIRKKYESLLKADKIDIPFTLSVIKNTSSVSNDDVVAHLSFSGESDRIHAVFYSDRYFLIWQTFFPIAVSLVLILLTTGCLWYMWRVIKQQAVLDEVKNDFINNMTHELRTPLAILKSTHEALDSFGEISDSVKTLKYLRINRGILDKLENDIDRILDITRYEKEPGFIKLEAFSLEDFITEIIHRFSHISSSVISLDSKLYNSQIVSDRYMMDTIVSNLIENAIKHAGKEVEITITISSSETGWQLQIQDNGPGIENKYIPFIFDKFYRVPSGNLHTTKGFGLGLNYVKQLTTLLKGQVTLQSTPGKGTLFTLQFPQDGKN